MPADRDVTNHSGCQGRERVSELLRLACVVARADEGSRGESEDTLAETMAEVMDEEGEAVVAAAIAGARAFGAPDEEAALDGCLRYLANCAEFEHEDRNRESVLLAIPVCVMVDGDDDGALADNIAQGPGGRARLMRVLRAFRRCGIVADTADVLLSPTLYRGEELPGSAAAWRSLHAELAHFAQDPSGAMATLAALGGEAVPSPQGERGLPVLRYLLTVVQDDSLWDTVISDPDLEQMLDAANPSGESVRERIEAWSQACASVLSEGLGDQGTASVGWPVNPMDATVSGEDLGNFVAFESALASAEEEFIGVSMAGFRSKGRDEIRLVVSNASGPVAHAVWVCQSPVEEEMDMLCDMISERGCSGNVVCQPAIHLNDRCEDCGERLYPLPQGLGHPVERGAERPLSAARVLH